jgi:hypothetical protein
MDTSLPPDGALVAPTLFSTYFRTPQGRWRTTSLFEETMDTAAKVSGLVPIFTLKEFDHNGYISLRRKYLEIGDPTEYEVATTCLGGWDHWRVICNSPVIAQYVQRWRDELRARLASDSYRIIRQATVAGGPTKAEVDAARWVYQDLLSDNQASNKLAPLYGAAAFDGSQLPAGKRKRGRPVNRPVLPSPGSPLSAGADVDYSEEFARMTNGAHVPSPDQLVG